MRKFFTGFSFAWQGLIYAFKTQVNLRFHFLIAALVVAAGLFFRVNQTQWLVLTLCIFIVISAELMNTAVEKLTDLVTSEMHPLAKIAKDCAAASVLVCAIGSAIVGAIIFVPAIIQHFF